MTRAGKRVSHSRNRTRGVIEGGGHRGKSCVTQAILKTPG
jgi:hypothetical protein